MGDALNATYGCQMRAIFTILYIFPLSAASTQLAPIVVKAKKEKPAQTWQFIESQTTEHTTTPGFEEQQLKNIPGVTTSTNGNPGQTTFVRIQGAASRYTKMMWNGLNIVEAEADAALIPLYAGKVEVIKGVHCAEYGNCAIGGIVNVVPFTMPKDQNGGARLTMGNYTQGSHLWWQQKTGGFSLQQHITADKFIGKNSIPKRYQDKYPTDLRPQTVKQSFLNQLQYENHHAKAALQLVLINSNSTASNIHHPKPCDARNKKSLQIYALDMESKSEIIQPYLKVLSTKFYMQDFSPYQNNGRYGTHESTKIRLGIRVKKESIVFEPLAECHNAAYKNRDDKSTNIFNKRGGEYAFAQGLHLHKNNLIWKNWARFHKSERLKTVNAFSSSLLSSYGDTEYSAHFGTGFCITDLFKLYNISQGGNPNLKNEKAIGGNLGVAQKTSVGTFSVLLFKTEYEQQIDWRDNKYININKSRQQGFELGWKNKVGAWGTQCSCLYTESVELEPRKALPNVPKFIANGRVFYEKGDCYTSIGCRYTGVQTLSDFESVKPVEKGDYAVLYGDVQYKITDHTTWQCAVENALARTIESPHGYRNPGFQISSGLSVTW